MKRILAVLILLVAVFSVTVAAKPKELSEDIVILHTNDIHSYIDKPISYDVLAYIKARYQGSYENVLLVDAGDHIQGTAYGSMDKGETVIKLMNETGYNLATLGNHEFDYGMFGCMNVIDKAEFPYVSCNFYNEHNGVRGENVLDSYVIFDCRDEKIAFVGITTPDTFTKSTPAYFQDENGNYIYGISAGEDGAQLYADVQRAIDDAKAEGASKVIALGHLGIDESSGAWTSERVIANVSGLDAFIDGHSHSIVRKTVLDKDGNSVLLTQTGQYFDRVGVMIIDNETGEIRTDHIYAENITDNNGEVTGYKLTSEEGLYEFSDMPVVESVRNTKEAWIKDINDRLGEKIGYTDIVFDNYNGDTRLVRSQETNSGSFCADALYYLFDNMDMDVDVAVMNAGGVRNKAVTGDISYLTCKEIHTFGNVACLQTVKGQQLLDALEWGARSVGVAESGGFLQVSGLTYKIRTDIPDTTSKDDKDIWTGGPEQYRVHSVKVYNKETNAWDDLDLNADYNLAGYNYTLRDLGDGFNMFDGAVNVLDYVLEDYMVLANYISGFSDRVVGAANSPLNIKYPGLNIDYSNVNGSGRITAEAELPTPVIPNISEAPENNAVLPVAVAVIVLAAAVVFIVIKKKK